MIFIDVDEVLADWSGAALRLLGLEVEDFSERWFREAPAIWNMFDAPGFPLDAAECWRRIDAAGSGFWSQLELQPWALELLAACRALGPTVLLTRPSPDPSSVMGKLIWMQTHLGGREFSDYLIGPPKHAVARAGVVLIDDHPGNCASFVEHGGEAIVFPALGNAFRNHRHDPLPQVLPKLEAWARARKSAD